jgi:hypothetical protein
MSCVSRYYLAACQDIWCCESCFDSTRIYAVVVTREADTPYGAKPHTIYASYLHCLSVSTGPPKPKQRPNSKAGRDGGAPPTPEFEGVALLSPCDP